MLQANFAAVCVIEAELLVTGFLICGEAELSWHAVLRRGNTHC